MSNKGTDWEFLGICPEASDLDARGNAFEDYVKGSDDSDLDDVDFFCAGFSRGMRWVIDKYVIEVPGSQIPEHMKRKNKEEEQ